MVNSSAKGNLRVTVVKSGKQELIRRRIILNGFQTEQVSLVSYRILSGEYEVSIDVGSELRIDSVVVNHQPVASPKPMVTVSPDQTTLVAFFVTKATSGKP